MRGGIDISAERSEVCLTDRYGNQIRAKGCENHFTVELCRYIDAIACRYGRTIEEYISGEQLCCIFQSFTEETFAVEKVIEKVTEEATEKSTKEAAKHIEAETPVILWEAEKN